MSLDSLQEKIRKTKNPSILEFNLKLSQLPPEYREAGVEGYGRYCCALLEKLQGKVPGVRFGFASFAVHGAAGLLQLTQAMEAAKKHSYYVLLDAPGIYSTASAELVAETVFGEAHAWPCDGLVIPGYLGSDIWKPFLPYCKNGKDIFVVVRSGNKSASDLQDLLTGSRLVHTVAADHVNRYGGDMTGKSGYSRVSILAAASLADSLRTLRAKYPRLFLLVDGYDYPNANAKNCAAAFDKLGHGAAVCAGVSITCAWAQAGSGGEDCLEQASAAADRMKKNLCRYVSVL